MNSNIKLTIQHLHFALNQVDAYIYIKDSHGNYLYANQITLDLFGCTQKSLREKNDTDFFPKQTVEELKKIDAKVFQGEKSQEEVYIDYGDDFKVYWEVKTPIYDDNNVDVIALLGISTDITQRKKLELSLKKSATTDSLTKLYNRSKMDELLEQEILRCDRYNKSFAFCMLDIDYFKQINDKYGHHVGDSFLIEFAQLLEKNTRKTDYVGRWGGEEFTIIFPETNEQEAKAIIEKIKNSIETYEFKEVGQQTCSFGLTLYEDRDSIGSLLQRADEAMYEAKKSGRNQLVFS